MSSALPPPHRFNQISVYEQEPPQDIGSGPPNSKTRPLHYSTGVFIGLLFKIKKKKLRFYKYNKYVLLSKPYA